MSSFLRIIWFGIQGFRRNIWLSLVAVFTMTLMLFSLTLFGVANFAALQAYKDFNKKVDYVVFVKDGASETDVQLMVAESKTRSETLEVKYLNKEDVRKNFDEMFKGDESLQGIITSESNPLPREMDVKFKDVTKIGDFDQFIKQDKYAEVVERTSYRDNESAIQNYLKIVKMIRIVGLSLTVFLGFVFVIVIMNTIRLTIHSRRDEIDIMRLVGATWQYIRGPFLVEGVIYGVLGAIFSSLFIWGIFYKLLDVMTRDLSLSTGFNSVSVFSFIARSTFNEQNNFVSLFNQLLWMQIFVGIILGIICSAIGVRKYLKE